MIHDGRGDDHRRSGKNPAGSASLQKSRRRTATVRRDRRNRRRRRQDSGTAGASQRRHRRRRQLPTTAHGLQKSGVRGHAASLMHGIQCAVSLYGHGRGEARGRRAERRATGVCAARDAGQRGLFHEWEALAETRCVCVYVMCVGGGNEDDEDAAEQGYFGIRALQQRYGRGIVAPPLSSPSQPQSQPASSSHQQQQLRRVYSECSLAQPLLRIPTTSLQTTLLLYNVSQPVQVAFIGRHLQVTVDERLRCPVWQHVCGRSRLAHPSRGRLRSRSLGQYTHASLFVPMTVS